jgi:hypothetical protein
MLHICFSLLPQIITDICTRSINIKLVIHYIIAYSICTIYVRKFISRCGSAVRMYSHDFGVEVQGICGKPEVTVRAKDEVTIRPTARDASPQVKNSD